MTCDQDLKEKMQISVKFSISMIIVFTMMKLLVATFIIKLLARKCSTKKYSYLFMWCSLDWNMIWGSRYLRELFLGIMITQFYHGRITEKDWQLIRLFYKRPRFGNYAHFLGRSQETWFRVCKLIVVKRLIQREFF